MNRFFIGLTFLCALFSTPILALGCFFGWNAIHGHATATADSGPLIGLGYAIAGITLVVLVPIYLFLGFHLRREFRHAKGTASEPRIGRWVLSVLTFLVGALSALPVIALYFSSWH